MTARINYESLCCQAAIDEQFHICKECREHAEPVTLYTDGTPVEVDASGFITGPLMNPDGTPIPPLPLTTETLQVLRQGFNDLPGTHDTKIGLIFASAFILIMCVLAIVMPFSSVPAGNTQTVGRAK